MAVRHVRSPEEYTYMNVRTQGLLSDALLDVGSEYIPPIEAQGQEYVYLIMYIITRPRVTIT